MKSTIGTLCITLGLAGPVLSRWVQSESAPARPSTPAPHSVPPTQATPAVAPAPASAIRSDLMLSLSDLFSAKTAQAAAPAPAVEPQPAAAAQELEALHALGYAMGQGVEPSAAEQALEAESAAIGAASAAIEAESAAIEAELAALEAGWGARLHQEAATQETARSEDGGTAARTKDLRERLQTEQTRLRDRIAKLRMELESLNRSGLSTTPKPRISEIIENPEAYDDLRKQFQELSQKLVLERLYESGEAVRADAIRDEVVAAALAAVEKELAQLPQALTEALRAGDLARVEAMAAEESAHRDLHDALLHAHEAQVMAKDEVAAALESARNAGLPALEARGQACAGESGAAEEALAPHWAALELAEKAFADAQGASDSVNSDLQAEIAQMRENLREQKAELLQQSEKARNKALQELHQAQRGREELRELGAEYEQLRQHLREMEAELGKQYGKEQSKAWKEQSKAWKEHAKAMQDAAREWGRSMPGFAEDGAAWRAQAEQLKLDAWRQLESADMFAPDQGAVGGAGASSVPPSEAGENCCCCCCSKPRAGGIPHGDQGPLGPRRAPGVHSNPPRPAAPGGSASAERMFPGARAPFGPGGSGQGVSAPETEACEKGQCNGSCAEHCPRGVSRFTAPAQSPSAEFGYLYDGLDPLETKAGEMAGLSGFATSECDPWSQDKVFGWVMPSMPTMPDFPVVLALPEMPTLPTLSTLPEMPGMLAVPYIQGEATQPEPPLPVLPVEPYELSSHLVLGGMSAGQGNAQDSAQVLQDLLRLIEELRGEMAELRGDVRALRSDVRDWNGASSTTPSSSSER